MHCKCKQANRAGCNRHKNGYPIYRSLTPAPSWATIPLPLQNQWLGCGSPTRTYGAQRPKALFLCPLWRAVRGTPSGVPVCLRSPVYHPAYGSPPSCGSEKGGLHKERGV